MSPVMLVERVSKWVRASTKSVRCLPVQSDAPGSTCCSKCAHWGNAAAWTACSTMVVQDDPAHNLLVAAAYWTDVDKCMAAVWPQALIVKRAAPLMQLGPPGTTGWYLHHTACHFRSKLP